MYAKITLRENRTSTFSAASLYAIHEVDTAEDDNREELFVANLAFALWGKDKIMFLCRPHTYCSIHSFATAENEPTRVTTRVPVT